MVLSINSLEWLPSRRVIGFRSPGGPARRSVPRHCQGAGRHPQTDPCQGSSSGRATPTNTSHSHSKYRARSSSRFGQNLACFGPAAGARREHRERGPTPAKLRLCSTLVDNPLTARLQLNAGSYFVRIYHIVFGDHPYDLTLATSGGRDDQASESAADPLCFPRRIRPEQGGMQVDVGLLV